MKKHAYSVEKIPDGVAITRGPADGSGRIVLQEDPAITFVCRDAKLATDLAGIVLEGSDWARELGVGVAIYVSGMGYELETPSPQNEEEEAF